MAVPGEALIQQINQNVPEFKVFAAPAFRFSKVWRNRVYSPPKDVFRVLVGLPMVLSEVKWMCNLVLQVTKLLSKENVEFWLKPHPNLENSAGFKKFSEYTKRPNVKMKTGDIYDALELSHLFIGASSSTCVEALSKGINTVVLGNENGITQNPIPEEMASNMWKICYGADEVKKYLLETIYNGKRCVDSHSLEVRSKCFRQVTYANIIQFIKDCKEV